MNRDSDGPADRESDSPVVPVTVRAVAPFVLTFGLFTLFHGTQSAGGGFQGGVVVASVVVAFAFGFGLSPVRAALGPGLLVRVAAAGLVGFGAVAAGSVALGGAFLDPRVYPVKTAYPVELVEIGIGLTVAAVVSLLFLELAGTPDPETESRASPGRGTEDDGDAR